MGCLTLIVGLLMTQVDGKDAQNAPTGFSDLSSSDSPPSDSPPDGPAISPVARVLYAAAPGVSNRLQRARPSAGRAALPAQTALPARSPETAAGPTRAVAPATTKPVRNSTTLSADHTAPVTTTSTRASYIGRIISSSGDTRTYPDLWLVGPDGHRRFISDAATYRCLKANGAPGPDVVPSETLYAMEDSHGALAVCGASRIGTDSILQTGFYARSPNGAYTLRLTQSNLALTDSNGHVVWSTGHGAACLIMQGDGNLVEYADESTPVWASNTVGSGAVWLDVTNDGHLTLSTSSGTVVWRS